MKIGPVHFAFHEQSTAVTVANDFNGKQIVPLQCNTATSLVFTYPYTQSRNRTLEMNTALTHLSSGLVSLPHSVLFHLFMSSYLPV
jgi:hypothetical protein